VQPGRFATGGQQITVYGAGFESSTTFTVNSQSCTNVTIVSPRQRR